MTLTAHALAGAAAASLMPENPALGFCAGFASHFVLDAIPHWNYEPRSPALDPKRGGTLSLNKALFSDLGIISFDGLLGLGLALLLFGRHGLWFPAFAGVTGAYLPDALHFVTARFPREPFISFTRFHNGIQRDIAENSALLGVLSQILFIAAFLGALHYVAPALL